MARVVSTGGFVTLLDMDRDLDPKTAVTINLNVRLFALVDNGLLAIDPASQSTGGGYSRDSLPSRSRLGDVTSAIFRIPQLPSGHRGAIWGGVIAALKELNIETDPETLQALPFEAIPIGRVLDVLPG